MKDKTPVGLKALELLAGWLSVACSRVVELWRGQSEKERALRDCENNPLAICCSLSLHLSPVWMRSNTQSKAEVQPWSSGNISWRCSFPTFHKFSVIWSVLTFFYLKLLCGYPYLPPQHWNSTTSCSPNFQMNFLASLKCMSCCCKY